MVLQMNNSFKNRTDFLIRFFDIIFSLCGLIFLWPFFILIFIFGLFDTGSPIFKQIRVGQFNNPFILYKFRTMNIDTISVASHLSSKSSITPFGKFLRKTKLDELPQLWNVLIGNMSFVGPRPCLYNQLELIKLRTSLNICNARPGITGLAQINSVDMSNPELLTKIEEKMILELSLRKYFKFIFLTLLGRGSGDRIS